jgi:hypothetical protein
MTTPTITQTLLISGDIQQVTTQIIAGADFQAQLTNLQNLIAPTQAQIAAMQAVLAQTPS